MRCTNRFLYFALRYVSSSSPGGGTSWMSDNVSGASLPDGGTGGEVCCLRMALLVSNKYTAVAAAGIIPAVASLHT